MTPATICAAFLQTFNVIEDLSPQVVFDLHIRESGRDIEDLLVRQLADLACWVDVEAGKEARGRVVSDTEEGLERFLGALLEWSGDARSAADDGERACLDEIPLGEVDAQDEDLVWLLVDAVTCAIDGN